MRLFRLCALGLALAADGADGYVDTAPFFMFSTSELLLSTPASSSLRSSSLLVSDVALSLTSCPSDYYIIVSQAGVSSRDFESTQSAPTLANALSRSGVRSSVAVRDVLGAVDTTVWTDVLRSTCGVTSSIAIDGSKGTIPTDGLGSSPPQLISLSFAAPSSKTRDLASNDALLATLLDLLPTQNYTVLYTNSGRSEERLEYAMDSEIQEALHLDLKRDLDTHVAAADGGNQTLVDGPLFHRYQFFTPGIFMGFLVGFLLLSILYVAISAVSSLQVTYAAFDKEQGALAGARKTQ